MVYVSAPKFFIYTTLLSILSKQNVSPTCLAHHWHFVCDNFHIHKMTRPTTLFFFRLLCRSGLGRDLTLAALKRGDKVIATGRARSLSKLDDLKQYGADTLELDVTSSLETLQDIAKKAVAIHGRIDILVNNAG